MREVPTDPPAVVPSMAAVSAGMSITGFAHANPEGGLAGDEEMGWHDEPDTSDGAFPAEAGER